ncbi:pectinesterase inhibitor 5-like [Malania oleifera]|uniref:pectinesterase inhibitor 5-like n=1 Tax=Malania oleifera TaxID=397392 RepID=UPI0025AE61A2|nr:pectinesterase inhibitor 5-like [Malania oleifera]
MERTLDDSDLQNGKEAADTALAKEKVPLRIEGPLNDGYLQNGREVAVTALDMDRVSLKMEGKPWQAQGIPNYCKPFFDDRRTKDADLRGLCPLSVAIATSRIQDTADRIPGLLSAATNPTDKQRLGVCQTDYSTALDKFKGAFSSASSEAYNDVVNLVREGANAAIDCNNVHRRSPPIGQSPIFDDNWNVAKMAGIVFAVVQAITVGF